MAKSTKEISYNQAMEEIEGIIEKLNNGELDIDTISQDVKRATELVVICKEKLKKSEDEIKQLFDTESNS